MLVRAVYGSLLSLMASSLLVACGDDDVIDVIEAETTEDILRFGGVSDEEEVRGSWWEAVQLRLPWLLVNLVTASAAGSASAVAALSESSALRICTESCSRSTESSV